MYTIYEREVCVLIEIECSKYTLHSKRRCVERWATRPCGWRRCMYPTCSFQACLGSHSEQEYGGYIADITRTWPVNGKFTGPQRDLYTAVLNVHRTCVALCREDANLSLDRLHGIAEKGLKEQLQQIGFDMSGDVW